MFRPLSLYIGLRYTAAKRRNHFISFISLTSMIGLMLGVAVLIIEHAMRVIMGVSNRICVLNYGECIAAGDTAAVCANPKVIEAYIGKTHVNR